MRPRTYRRLTGTSTPAAALRAATRGRVAGVATSAARRAGVARGPRAAADDSSAWSIVRARCSGEQTRTIRANRHLTIGGRAVRRAGDPSESRTRPTDASPESVPAPPQPDGGHPLEKTDPFRVQARPRSADTCRAVTPGWPAVGHRPLLARGLC